MAVSVGDFCSMRYWMLFVLVAVLGCHASKQAGTAPVNDLRKQLQESLTHAVIQYKYLGRTVPEHRFPRTFEQGKLQTTGADGWVSGFFPGTLLQLYRFSGDAQLWEIARQKLNELKPQQFNQHTHDLGFMMYGSFGQALPLFPSAGYDSILINSARSLCSRFDPKVGCIRSWDSDSSHFLVIIDNMMNLELLMHCFRETGDSLFYKVAVAHANTTLQNHFRADGSSWHVVDYDPKTGLPQRKHTHQGAADGSAWARGQAWGLYGFTVMYRETGDRRYLYQANRIAAFILNHPNWPADAIPYWDFNAPDIPNAYRDASAAAVMASALLELKEYAPSADKKRYMFVAEKILQQLSSAAYRTSGNEAGGFLLQHSVGHFPNHSEIDVPLSYADYYYAEAALRYLGLVHPKK